MPLTTPAAAHARITLHEHHSDPQSNPDAVIIDQTRSVLAEPENLFKHRLCSLSCRCRLARNSVCALSMETILVTRWIWWKMAEWTSAGIGGMCHGSVVSVRGEKAVIDVAIMLSKSDRSNVGRPRLGIPSLYSTPWCVVIHGNTIQMFPVLLDTTAKVRSRQTAER